ncbi:MAG: TolC family protein [Deltaproteobacteria bacterium]|nr:TolC family protein [Deltaproteobacteria bacterium]
MGPRRVCLILIAALGAGAARAEQPMRLAECVREALARNPRLGVARAGLSAAQAGRIAARAAYLPRLTVESSDSYYFVGQKESIYIEGQGVPYEREAYHDDLHGFGLYLSQTLFDGGVYWLQPRRADAELARSQLEMAATTEQLVLAVVESFHLLGRALHEERVLQASLDLSRAQLELARERHRLGDASKVDVSRARVSVGEDRIALERQRAALDQAREELNLAMGRMPDAPLEIAQPAGFEDESPPLPAGPARGPVRIEDHIVLQLQRAAERVAELDEEIAEAGWWPTVTGHISYSRQDPEFYKVYSRFDELFTLNFGLRIVYPLFEGFALEARIETARAQAERVRSQRALAEQDLGAQRIRAERQIERLQRIYGVEADNVTAAADSLTLAQERYAVGEGTALEIRDAQLAVTRARLARVQTRFDLLIATARLQYARGELADTYIEDGDSP